MSDPIALTPPPLTAGRHRRDPAATRQRWVDRLDRFRTAEQPVAAFCAAEGVSVPAFYQWKRQLAAEAVGPADPPALIPVRVAARARPPSNWLSPAGPSSGSARAPTRRHCGRRSPDRGGRMLTVPPSVKLWYAPTPVDFRLGFDGLFARVKARLAADPMSGHLLMLPSLSPSPRG